MNVSMNAIFYVESNFPVKWIASLNTISNETAFFCEVAYLLCPFRLVL